MRIERVNVVIPTNLNKHRKYLYNEMLDLMNAHRFGGEFKNENIKLSSAPKSVLGILDKLKVKYNIGDR